MRSLNCIFMVGVLLIFPMNSYADLLGNNISGSAEMASTKAKIDTMPIYVSTQDSEGKLSEYGSKSKRIIITYTDEISGSGGTDFSQEFQTTEYLKEGGKS